MLKITKNLNMIWVGLFFLILAISAPWFNLHISNHDIVKSYIASFGISLLLLASIYFKSFRSNIVIKINYIKLTLFLLFIYALFSLLWSINIDFSIGKLMLWIIAAFSFMLSLNLSTTNENLIKLAWGLIIAAGSIALIGILQYYFNPFSLTQASWPASTFGNKNMAMQPLILILPLSIFLLFSRQIQGQKIWALLGITSLSIAYVIVCESRSAWLSIVVEISAISIYFLIFKAKVRQWIEWNKQKRNACIFAIIFTIALIIIPPYGEWESLNFTNTLTNVGERITSTGSSSDAAFFQRFQIWQTAINMFIDAPFFGTGLGSFAQNLGNEGYATWTINNTMRAHNDLIELGVELGLVGVLFFLTFIVTLIIGTFRILQKTNGEIHIFTLIIFVSLMGSFINLQFSFPYQMAFPLLLFGLYSGLIAQILDQVEAPIKTIKISFKSTYKKIILIIFASLILILFYFTYFQWIIAYEKFDGMSRSENFNHLEVINTPIYEQKFQFMLYSLGGKYFENGNYVKSKLLDKKFLEVWPNHLDVLFRASYAEHATGNNSVALEMAKKLKEIEPEGLYNSYMVEMFVYMKENKINKLEETFQKLLLEPEEFLELDEDTYRLMIFFTLASENLSKYAKNLYEKYLFKHGYSCEVENNIAIHYFNLENYNQASMQVKKTNGKNQKCLNPDLIRILKEMGALV